MNITLFMASAPELSVAALPFVDTTFFLFEDAFMMMLLEPKPFMSET